VSVGRWIARLVKRRAEPPAAPDSAPAARVEPEPEVEPEPRGEAVVNERTARALLATGTPPLPPEPGQPTPPQPVTPPGPAKAEPAAGEPRAWNLWELERAVRQAPDQERHEEWSALLIHLREFANAEGDLPVEFDALVRESFAGILAQAATR
jgi:hypothetical protein